jgi:hypothetical protein
MKPLRVVGREARPSKAGTILQLTSSQNPSAVNQRVTFTAVVSSSGGTLGGTVTFKEGSTLLGTRTLDATGKATVVATFTSAPTLSVRSICFHPAMYFLPTIYFRVSLRLT